MRPPARRLVHCFKKLNSAISTHFACYPEETRLQSWVKLLLSHVKEYALAIDRELNWPGPTPVDAVKNATLTG